MLFPIHAVIRRNSSDGSLGIANSSPPSSPPIIAESNGFRMAVEPIQTIGFPLSGNVLLPGGSVFPGQDDVMLEIYAAPKSELVVPSLPSPDLGQVGARVFAHVSDPNIRLRDMLACQVCHELMFDTVTASPCCHHFCAPCLSQWLDSDNANAHSCPVCRVILSAATPDPLVRAICAAYVQVEPSHARAPEEIRQLQKVDTSSIARVGERRRHVRWLLFFRLCRVQPLALSFGLTPHHCAICETILKNLTIAIRLVRMKTRAKAMMMVVLMRMRRLGVYKTGVSTRPV